MAVPAPRPEIEARLESLARSEGPVDPSKVAEVMRDVLAALCAERSGVEPSLRAELETLASYISTARAEIAAIKADEVYTQYVPAANDELFAIIGATEQATHDIMAAVEGIESAAERMPPELAEPVVASVTRVYEACGFQDITGQRVSKVVSALQKIEAKVQALLAALGEQDAAGLETPAGARSYPENLLNGPQLPENAISQDDVDALLADRE